MIYGQKCSNCGHGLTDDQIVAAIHDSGVDIPIVDGEYDTASEAYDAMYFCCSTYTGEHGCQGNDTLEPAYWYVR